MLCKPTESFTVLRFSQLLNALSKIYKTLPGIEIVSRLVQLAKADSYIRTTPFAILTFLSDVQPSNACCEIESTLPGIVTAVSEVQF